MTYGAPSYCMCSNGPCKQKAEDSTEGCVFMSGYTRWVADSWFIQRHFINCTGCTPPAIGTQLNCRDLKYATLITLHLIEHFIQKYGKGYIQGRVILHK
jgi:hypothetical protein